MKQFSVHDNPNKIVEHLMMCSGMAATGRTRKPELFDIEWNDKRYELQAADIKQAMSEFETYLEERSFEHEDGYRVEEEDVIVIGYDGDGDVFTVTKKACVIVPNEGLSDYYYERRKRE